MLILTSEDFRNIHVQIYTEPEFYCFKIWYKAFFFSCHNTLHASEEKGTSVWWVFHTPKSQDAQGLFIALSVTCVTLRTPIRVPE